MIKLNPSGFTMIFANGVTASVQFGPINYCENRSLYNNGAIPESCKNAEVIAWNEAGDYITEARGWLSPDEVAAFLKEMSEFKN